MSDFRISPISTIFPTKKRCSYFEKELDFSGLCVLIDNARESFRINSAHDLWDIDEKISRARAKFWILGTIELLGNSNKSISIYDLLDNKESSGDEGNRKKKIYEMISGLKSGKRKPNKRTIEKVEHGVPESAVFLNHPIWHALSSRPINNSQVRDLYEQMPRDIKRAIDIDSMFRVDKLSIPASNEMIKKISMSEDPFSALALLLQILKLSDEKTYINLLHAIYELLLLIGVELQRWGIAVEIIDLCVLALQSAKMNEVLMFSMTASAIFENSVKTSMIPFADIKATGKLKNKKISFQKRLSVMRAQLNLRKRFYYEVLPVLVVK